MGLGPGGFRGCEQIGLGESADGAGRVGAKPGGSKVGGGGANEHILAPGGSGLPPACNPNGTATHDDFTCPLASLSLFRRPSLPGCRGSSAATSPVAGAPAPCLASASFVRTIWSPGPSVPPEPRLILRGTGSGWSAQHRSTTPPAGEADQSSLKAWEELALHIDMAWSLRP